MPIQEISSELDSLLQKGETVYWQAIENRQSVTTLSPWAKLILGSKVETITPQDDWFKNIHAADLKNVLQTIADNDGNEAYSVEYRWEITKDSYVWIREIGIRREPGSKDFEGLLYNINSQKESEKRTLKSSKIFPVLARVAFNDGPSVRVNTVFKDGIAATKANILIRAR